MNRLFLWISIFVSVAFLLASCGTSRTADVPQEPGVSPTPTPPKMEPPPEPPYKLTDADEIEIDKASNRPQLYVLTAQESEKKLSEYQVKLKQCDEALAKKKDDCQLRFSTLYCMLMADRYAELGKLDDARSFYLEAVKRTYNDHQSMGKNYEEGLKQPPPAGSSEAAKIMTEAYNAAKFHFQAYKDFGEIARYQKRMIELLMKKGEKDKIPEHWKFVEESVKASAEFKKAFLKDYEKLKAVKDKIPPKYMDYFNDIADLSTSLKIEPI